ncbi:ATP-grasp domain-containing protein [Streptomyces sp. NPDC056160]|uniref:ATP-grasp domain-containing protein n=1 Tax=Streptomyces sp. NPDC056160 TaxID=3345731 RepID=UPI0035DA68B8
MTALGTFAVVETWLSPVGRTPLVAARELGFDTLFLTRDLGVYTRTPESRTAWQECAGRVVICDTQDPAAVVAALAQEADLRGVFTTNDYNVPVVAEAARALHLPGLDPQAARRACDKQLTRQTCHQAGVPTPGWHWARTAEGATVAARTLGLPCVVKPLTDAASIGVRLCRTTAEVVEQFHTITASPEDFRGGLRKPGVLVEEYLIGPEVSVEIVATEAGEHVVLGVTDKALGPHPHFVELGETFPSVLPGSVQEEARTAALAALRALGHDFGAAHVEIKLTPRGPRLVEVNARMPGAWITRLIREAVGVDLQRELVRLYTGERPDLKVRELGGAASRYLTSPDTGQLAGVHGLDLAAHVPGTVEVEVHAEAGDQVRRARDNVDVIGSVVATGRTGGEAARRADTALGQLGVTVTEEREQL